MRNKSCSYFVHDYSSFGEEKIIYDFSLLDWSSLDNSDISVNDHLNFFFEKTKPAQNNMLPRIKLLRKI